MAAYGFLGSSGSLGRIFQVASSTLCSGNSILYRKHDEARRPPAGFRKRTDIVIQCISTRLRASPFIARSMLNISIHQVFDQPVFVGKSWAQHSAHLD
jgi:hypothetical protein